MGVVLFSGKSELRKSVIEAFYKNSKIIMDVLFVGAFGLSWLAFLGTHDFGSNQAYFHNLKPLLNYLAMINLVWLFIGLLYNYRSKKLPRGNKINLWVLIGPILIFCLLVFAWIVVYLSGFGITPKFIYWGNAGTLLFGYQVILALIIAAASSILVSEIRKNWGRFSPKKTDLIVFFALWAIAAILLVHTEPNHNFFAPTIKNGIYYPYSDAARYDTFAQSILVGEGFSNKYYTLRPVYVTFLAVLHLFSQQNYEILVNLQAGLCAISIAYLFLNWETAAWKILRIFCCDPWDNPGDQCDNEPNNYSGHAFEIIDDGKSYSSFPNHCFLLCDCLVSGAESKKKINICGCRSANHLGC